MEIVILFVYLHFRCISIGLETLPPLKKNIFSRQSCLQNISCTKFCICSALSKVVTSTENKIVFTNNKYIIDDHNNETIGILISFLSILEQSFYPFFLQVDKQIL